MSANTRPVHFQHHAHTQYLHTYCGLINFQGYRPWNFVRSRKPVTCKRCVRMLERDEGVIPYRERLAFWKARWKAARAARE